MGAAAIAKGGKKRGMITGINITPMVDVVLVLLVIMMVSANYIVSQTIKVDLPNAASSDGPAPQVAAVTLTKDGALHFNGEPVTEPVLTEKLKAAGTDPETSLVVSADEGAKHGAVMHVIDLARLAGITKFAVNVEQVE